MKKYNELELVIVKIDRMDVITTSFPDGDNNLPWVDVNAADDSQAFYD